jgi:methionyl-tRNA formyltransferase
MFTKFRGGRLIILRAREIQTNSLAGVSAEPGTIQTIDAAGITLQTGSGVLLIEDIQMEGKRRVSAREFANGARLMPGDHMNQSVL